MTNRTFSSPIRPVGPSGPVGPGDSRPPAPSAIPPIVLPHGGYKNLLAYRKSDVVYQGTVCFCRRFLRKSDRTFDQMVQAARSGKQNIVEGSQAAGTSKETELKLTNVARASLEELLEDYRDYLRTRSLPVWEERDPRRETARRLGREHNDFDGLKDLFETQTDEVLGNLQICFVHQTMFLLDKLIKHLEEDFKSHGGIRERMHDARTAARGADWEKAVFSHLSASGTPEELSRRTVEVEKAVERIRLRLSLQRGWPVGGPSADRTNRTSMTNRTFPSPSCPVSPSGPVGPGNPDNPFF